MSTLTGELANRNWSCTATADETTAGLGGTDTVGRLRRAFHGSDGIGARRARYRLGAVDPVPLVDRAEEPVGQIGRLRTAEKQQPARPERKVQHLHHLLLHLAVEVDQQVAAAHEIEVGERRVAQHVVRGEQNLLAQLLAHPEMRLLALEEVSQPLPRDIGRDGLRVQAGAPQRNRPLVDVGCKDVDVGRAAALRHDFAEQDADRIGLFAGGTAGDPGARSLRFRPAGEQARVERGTERLERLRIAEEVGDADQQVFQQRGGFVEVGTQKTAVLGQVPQARDLESPLDAAQHRRRLVVLEVVAGALAQQAHDLGQCLPGLRSRIG